MHKRCPSPFIYFCIKNRPIIDTKYPNLNFIEKSKMLDEMWKKLDEMDRKNYTDEYYYSI